MLTKNIYFLQRLLGLFGVESLKYLQSFFNNNNFLNQYVINDCLKILQKSKISLKKESKYLKKRYSIYFFEYNQNFPKKILVKKIKL